MANYWKQVIRINDYQKSRFVNRVVASMFNTVAGKRIIMPRHFAMTMRRRLSCRPRCGYIGRCRKPREISEFLI